jgi:hypothetical protein
VTPNEIPNLVRNENLLFKISVKNFETKKMCDFINDDIKEYNKYLRKLFDPDLDPDEKWEIIHLWNFGSDLLEHIDWYMRQTNPTRNRNLFKEKPEKPILSEFFFRGSLRKFLLYFFSPRKTKDSFRNQIPNPGD